MAEAVRLGTGDAARYMKFRRRMLLDAPLAFSATPDDDRALEATHLARYLTDDRKALFGVEQPIAEIDGKRDADTTVALIAAAGLVGTAAGKFAHRARIWGVFVDPDYRGRGLGRLVMRAAIALAEKWDGVDYIDLGVSENSTAAWRLYESLGFEAWGREPETTQWEGKRYDEIFMTLRLAPKS